MVEVYDPERVFDGTTLLAIIGVGGPSRIVEIAMTGDVVWELELPQELAGSGETVWTYAHPTPLRTTRDCDRLPNGNTLIVGVKDEGDSVSTIDESTLIEVTSDGDVVWQLTLHGVAVDTSPGLFFKAEQLGSGSRD